MSSEVSHQRWQFGLQSFLFAVLIVGVIAGVIAPIILDAITEWKPPQQVPSRTTTTPVVPSAESESYYESGETPLY